LFGGPKPHQNRDMFILIGMVTIFPDLGRHYK
jgi:hypothetical protein